MALARLLRQNLPRGLTLKILQHCCRIIFARSTSLPPHGVQLHFVGKRLFRGQNALTLEIAVHHDNDGFIVGQLPDDAGHRGQFRQLRRKLAAVAGHHLITAVRHGPHQHGRENTALPDALHHLLHFLVHPHLKRVVWKVADFSDGQVGHIAALGVVPFLLGGEHTID